MVRIHDWKEFDRSARDIFAHDPENTRFVIKQATTSTEKEGIVKKKVTVTLRVTDDKKTITFETTERCFVKRIGRLTRWFAVRMASTAEDLAKGESSIKAKLMD
jgi:hypothetical protein